ncbi:MAG: hypothetical protein ACLFP1_02920 [Candidatus Goldiibacteriota bacterium]
MKKTAVVFMIIFLPVSLFAVQARNTELVDILTANTLSSGEMRVEAKFYPNGDVLNKLSIGIFDKLMIGGIFNVKNLIASGDVSFDVPQFLVKWRFTDDKDAWPALAIGYEGMGNADVQAKGLYLAATKELASGDFSVQLTLDIYSEDFADFRGIVDAGAGIAMAVTREFVVTAEYDGILGIIGSRHINFGIGYFFDPIEIDVGIRYGIWSDHYYLSRMLKIMYIRYF